MSDDPKPGLRFADGEDFVLPTPEEIAAKARELPAGDDPEWIDPLKVTFTGSRSPEG